MEGMGKRYSWCHAVKEGLGCLIESLRTGTTKEHVHSECLDMPAFVSDLGSVPNHCEKTNIAKK